LKGTDKNIESKLSERKQEIHVPRQKDAMNADAISALSDQIE
jgi:hypothetical protein